jgi:dTDP-glucose pyrophosphorylase
MSKPVLIVMAAGIGSRYGGFKQIGPIGPHGEMLLDYSVYDAKRSGFGKIVFVINRQMELEFRERIDQSLGKSCEVEYVYQELGNLPAGFQVPQGREKPWGTAHAVLCCKEIVDASFAVINADDFYGRSAYQSLADYLQQAKIQNSVSEFCMIGYRLENTLTEHGYVSRGICSVDQQGNLIEVHERTRIQKINGKIKYLEENQKWIELPDDCVVSLNTWGFTPELFGILDEQFEKFLDEKEDNLATAEFFLPDLINDLLQEQRASVKVLPTQEHWFGVTYREDAARVKQAIRKMLDNGVYPKKLWG